MSVARRMVEVELGDDRVVLSWHAVKRWRERCEPKLNLHRAVKSLGARTFLRGVIERRRPHGIECLLRHQLQTVAWLIVDDAVFPLIRLGDELVATTCIARRK